MLACQHGGKTTAAELLSATSRLRSARPVARPNIREAVAHEEKDSRRRYRRHACKTADVASQRARISFRSTNGPRAIPQEIQRERPRLEIRPGINWFSSADPERSDHERSIAFGQRLGRLQVWPRTWLTARSDERRRDPWSRQFPGQRP